MVDATLKEKTVKGLREIGTRMSVGCCCKMFTCAEMADEVENDTKHGKEHMKVVELWEQNKHKYV